MGRLSPDIELGENLAQEQIESAFDTGFGYRISGINPRRDNHDRRYILVFANEDGPYNDSVTEGRFEYVGEGLSGDQSMDSPGNSALVDATRSDIPIHFFYKPAEDADWEYQGLVDAVDYEFQERDGREVLIFTLEHQENERKEPQHEGSPESIDELLNTLSPEQLREFISIECDRDQELRNRLRSHFDEHA